MRNAPVLVPLLILLCLDKSRKDVSPKKTLLLIKVFRQTRPMQCTQSTETPGPWHDWLMDQEHR